MLDNKQTEAKQIPKMLKSNYGECWIGIQYAVLHTQKYTPSQCYFRYCCHPVIAFTTFIHPFIYPENLLHCWTSQNAINRRGHLHFLKSLKNKIEDYIDNKPNWPDENYVDRSTLKEDMKSYFHGAAFYSWDWASP